MSDEVTVATCPECAQGKPQNCAQLALLGDDLVPCRNSREITDPPDEATCRAKQREAKQLIEVWPPAKASTDVFVVEYFDIRMMGTMASCKLCGAVVFDKSLHAEWHSR